MATIVPDRTRRPLMERRPKLAAAGLLAAALILGGAAGRSLARRQAQNPNPPLRPCPSLGGRQVFPRDNPWNEDVSRKAVDPNSDVLIAGIGPDKPLFPAFGTIYQGVPV